MIAEARSPSMYDATKGIHHTLEMFKTYVAPHMSRISCAVDRVLEFLVETCISWET